MVQINPVAFKIGGFAIHWYGLMYLISFILASVLMRYRIKKYQQYKNWTFKEADDLLFYCILGVVVGGRAGYVLFYQWAYYSQNLQEIFKVWHGGMSFHGGLIGVLVAILLFSYKTKKTFFTISDFIAPLVPIGLFFGRIGNFINGELWGRMTTSSWGMVFPAAGDSLTRHPSQLYQMATEGLVLFIILWAYLHKPRVAGTASGLFLFFYGSLRFFTEFFREPDAFLGLQALGWTMGQWLCLPMIGLGATILFLGEMKNMWSGKFSMIHFGKKKNIKSLETIPENDDAEDIKDDKEENK
ncbi:MAG: prolipoprotein diacylglyceryl transferase [Pseudomonadota bacterium]|jgi:phosphatidylglycerol:prolipoprotein diacylglycerol transferase